MGSSVEPPAAADNLIHGLSFPSSKKCFCWKNIFNIENIKVKTIGYLLNKQMWLRHNSKEWETDRIKADLQWFVILATIVMFWFSFAISSHPSSSTDPVQSTHLSCQTRERSPSDAKPCSLASYCFSFHFLPRVFCLYYPSVFAFSLLRFSLCDLRRGKKWTTEQLVSTSLGVTYIIYKRHFDLRTRQMRH